MSPYIVSVRPAISLVERRTPSTTTPSIGSPSEFVNYDMLIPPVRRRDQTATTIFSLNSPTGAGIIVGFAMGTLALFIGIVILYRYTIPWIKKKREYRRKCERAQENQRQWLRQFKQPFPSPRLLSSLSMVSEERDLENTISVIGRRDDSQERRMTLLQSTKGDLSLSLRSFENPSGSTPIIGKHIANTNQAYVR